MLPTGQHTRSLQLWILFLAVLLPSGILASLGIQGVIDEQSLIRDETVRRGGVIAAGLTSLVRDQFGAAERAADSAAAEWTGAGATPTHAAPSAISVCVVDKDYRLLFPAAGDVANGIPPAEDGGELAALQADISPIEQREAEGRFEEAYLGFEQLLSAASGPQAKAVLLNCMARTRKKAGRMDEAAALYQRVIREFPDQSGLGGISLAVVAHLECVRAAILKNDEADALRCVQAFLDQIRLGRLTCRRSQFLFARQRLAGWLTELGHRGVVSPSEAESCLRQLDRIDALLAAQAIAAASRAAAGLDHARTDGYGYGSSPSGILGARWLSPARDRAVVFLLDRDQFRADLTRAALATFAYAERFDYVISDLQGRPLLSSGEPAAGEPHASVVMGGGRPVSTVAVHVVQSAAVRAHVQRRRALSLAAVGALVVMIATSLLLVMRIVRRERDMSRMKDNFVASVSHEMRLPLSTIKMVGEMFSFGKVQGEAQAADYYHILDDETERLTRLVNRVLDFGRMESGRMPYERIVQPVAPIVAEAVARFRMYVRNAVVDIDVPPETGSAPVDRDGLLEVVINLLENAVKYSPVNPTVQVRSCARNCMVLIEVADNGIGMDACVVTRIFEAFYRGENELTRETQGAGIGLAIVKHIVDAHGGRIEVQSQKGKGSIFTVKLPVA
jgi:signal transduction histidine kinase